MVPAHYRGGEACKFQWPWELSRR